MQKRFLFMAGLIVAGEAAFALPFHVARFFRPTVLEVFDISATELGVAQGVYGLVAMIAYLPGGALADRFSARKLLAWSLWATALGGLYMASLPGVTGAIFIWGFYGATTILLFWAALIKAARDWGGTDSQGQAYGLLEGGRGLLAALLGSIGVYLFGLAFPTGYEAATFEDKEAALRTVIHGYTLVTALTGAFIWFVIPERDTEPTGRPSAFHQLVEVLKLPAVWLQAMVLVCAYVAYKGYDNYSLYAVQAWGVDPVEAASMVAAGSWLRPVAALLAGIVADRISGSRTLLMCFSVLLLSDLFFAFADPLPDATWIMFGNFLVGFTAFFSMRGVYFALLEETKVSMAATGSAVGVVSIIGFTPDIFVAYIAGLLIDRSPGATGHQHFFMFLSLFAALGIAASYILLRRLRTTV